LLLFEVIHVATHLWSSLSVLFCCWFPQPVCVEAIVVEHNEIKYHVQINLG
jgi:hypothetical protein